MSWYRCFGVLCVLVVGCSGENSGTVRTPSGGTGPTLGGNASSSVLGGATTMSPGTGGQLDVSGGSGAGSPSNGGTDGIGGSPGAGGNATGASPPVAGSGSGGAATGGRPVCAGPSTSAAANAAAPLRDDRDGQTYSTIAVGSQVWMAQNLNVGEQVPGITEAPGQCDDSKIEKFCVDDLPDNCARYGGMYMWPEAMGLSWKCATLSCVDQLVSPQRGICPTGWHIPTQTEWSTLAQNLANLTGLTAMSTQDVDRWTDLGLAMKSTTCWNEGGNGTNATGFNAIPAGYRHSWGGFYAVGGFACFHSTTEIATNYTEGRGLSDAETAFYRTQYYEDHAVSVRCVKD
jgi:uncharacterized protein (TIGR02145 family)